MITILNSFNEREIHVMDSFEFEYGRVLEDVEVEYATYGTPKYDDEGYITNAVMFFSTFRGIYSLLRVAHEYIVKNSNLVNEFYFIVIKSLGTPDSCSPSTTGLNDDFPRFTIVDQVNFTRQFLAEKFKIKKILGLIGEGIGGFQILSWACEYPDDMQFIFIVNSAAKVSGYRFIIAKVFENIIDIADDSDDYSISKNKAIIAINALLFAHSSSKYAFDNLDNDEILAIFDDFADECFFRDIHDFKFRNGADMEFDVTDKLSNIKAKSLFIGTNDNYFHSELDIAPFKKSVKDSIVLIQKEPKKDYYFKEDDYAILGDQVISFLEQFVE